MGLQRVQIAAIKLNQDVMQCLEAVALVCDGSEHVDERVGLLFELPISEHRPHGFRQHFAQGLIAVGSWLRRVRLRLVSHLANSAAARRVSGDQA